MSLKLCYFPLTLENKLDLISGSFHYFTHLFPNIVSTLFGMPLAFEVCVLVISVCLTFRGVSCCLWKAPSQRYYLIEFLVFFEMLLLYLRCCFWIYAFSSSLNIRMQSKWMFMDMIFKNFYLNILNSVNMVWG